MSPGQCCSEISVERTQKRPLIRLSYFRKFKFLHLPTQNAIITHLYQLCHGLSCVFNRSCCTSTDTVVPSEMNVCSSVRQRTSDFAVAHASNRSLSMARVFAMVQWSRRAVTWKVLTRTAILHRVALKNFRYAALFETGKISHRGLHSVHTSPPLNASTQRPNKQ